MIGCLGDIVFEVSDKKAMTASDIQISCSARISEHKLHGRTSLTEFTGIDAEKLKLKIKLMSELGVDVNEMLEKIQAHMEAGTPLPLVFGTQIYGRHRWIINSYTAPLENIDYGGNLSSATVSLNLIEYADKQELPI